MGFNGRSVSEDRQAIDVEAYYRGALTSEALQMLSRACAQVPEFRELVAASSSASFMVRAILGTPRRLEWTTEDWIVHVASGYFDALCAGQDTERSVLQVVAWEDFVTGDSRYSADYLEEECLLNDGKGAGRWVRRGQEGASEFTNSLVQHYFVADRMAKHQGRDMLRMEFPRRWILMFLSVLAPDLVARMTEQRGGELRAQIEQEVELRVQATLSHQLKRSAGAVRSHLKKIRSKVTREQFKEFAGDYDRILQEAQYQIELAERTAVWAAEPELKLGPVSLRPIVEEALVPLRERFAEIALQVEVPPDLRARGDARWIREVVFHLAENAFQAVFAGSPGREGKVTVRGSMDAQTARIEVLDSGVGVHAEDAERIFHPRVTSKKGGERQPLGTGMGLPIARRHAQHMGGRVEIRLHGPLTCFFLELPGVESEEVP